MWWVISLKFSLTPHFSAVIISDDVTVTVLTVYRSLGTNSIHEITRSRTKKRLFEVENLNAKLSEVED